MKKKIICLFLILSMTFVLTGCDSSKYKKASGFLEDGNYEEAVALFEELGDYEDSAEMLKKSKFAWGDALLAEEKFEEAKVIFAELDDYENSKIKVENCETGITLRDYGNVVKALSKKQWTFNGGTNYTINTLEFSDSSATIWQRVLEGNADAKSNTCHYIVDDKKVTIYLAGGTQLEIPYSLKGKAVKLKGDYFDQETIDKEIQGYWKCRKEKKETIVSNVVSDSEHNLYFHNGKLTHEHAAASLVANVGSGEYFYYGPDKGTYTLDRGKIEMKYNENGSSYNTESFFYNIIDGKVTIVDFTDMVYERSDSLPGQYGYTLNSYYK